MSEAPSPSQIVARMIAAALREIPDKSSCEGWSFETDSHYITQPSQLAAAFERGDMPQRCTDAALSVLRRVQPDD